MDLVTGNKCILKLQLVGEATAYVCIRTLSFQVDTTEVDIMSNSDGNWADWDYDINNYTITVDGLLVLLDESVPDPQHTPMDVLQVQMQFIEVPWELIFKDDADVTRTMSGLVMVKRSLFTMPAVGYAEFSNTFLGKGPPVGPE